MVAIEVDEERVGAATRLLEARGTRIGSWKARVPSPATQRRAEAGS